MSSAPQLLLVVAKSSPETGSTTTIGKDMSPSDILKQIGARIEDITMQLDQKECNKHAMEHGGSCSVHFGRLNDGTRIAIKRLHLEVSKSVEGRQKVESFARELYVWSKCKDPNVINLIGMAEYRGRFALVSPWMEIGSLKRFLNRNPCSLSQRLQLCVQITSGVAYLHTNEIVHGDLKAVSFELFKRISSHNGNNISEINRWSKENILMSSASTICITDFGCSTIKGASLAFPSSDVDSGTIRWTAPEILLSDKGKPSYKGDIHSLGMTILEVLTGSIPYSDKNEAEALSRVTQGRVPERPLEQVPKGSKQADAIWLLLVQNCWALEPKDRISAVDLHYQIKAIHEGGE